MSRSFEEKMATLSAQLDELRQHAPAAATLNEGERSPESEDQPKPKLLATFVNMKDNDGNTFLHRAPSNCISQWVTKYSPDLEACNKAGLTPLLNHALHGNLSGVIALLKHGANPYATDAKGCMVFDYLRLQDLKYDDRVHICDLLKKIDESA